MQIVSSGMEYCNNNGMWKSVFAYFAPPYIIVRIILHAVMKAVN